MINKLFPSVDYSKIKYDKEGLYSITHHKEADLISKLILNLFHNKMNLTIMDCTGGLGGNTISFCKYFKNVTTIEINKERYKMLKNNIKLYGYSNIKLINKNSIDYLLNNYDKYDVFFIDPPWGGVNYKKHDTISLTMNDYKLNEIINKLNEKTTDKLIIYKLPFNYNFDEFNSYNYKLCKINKYYIIIIYI